MEKNNKFRAIRQDGLIDRTGSYIGQAHRIGRTYRTRRLDEKLQDIIETRERTFEYTFEDPFFYMNRLLFRPSLASLYEGTFSSLVALFYFSCFLFNILLYDKRFTYRLSIF